MSRDEQARANVAFFTSPPHDLKQQTDISEPFRASIISISRPSWLSIFIYSAIITPSTPESPARTRFWPGPTTAPLVAVEFEAEVEDAEVEVPVTDVVLPVIEAEEPVSEGPDAADPVGSAVPEVAEELVAVALSPARILSRPAVIVTDSRLLVRSLTTVVITPGSLAPGPATV